MAIVCCLRLIHSFVYIVLFSLEVGIELIPLTCSMVECSAFRTWILKVCAHLGHTHWFNIFVLWDIRAQKQSWYSCATCPEFLHLSEVFVSAIMRNMFIFGCPVYEGRGTWKFPNNIVLVVKREIRRKSGYNKMRVPKFHSKTLPRLIN